MSSEQIITIKESSFSTLQLSPIQASELRRIGRDFANQTNEFEDADESSLEDEVVGEKTVIDCIRVDSSATSDGLQEYRIKVRNRIGSIRIDGLTLLIQPKIPFDHFAYITKNAVGNPACLNHSVDLSTHQTFQELIARWFLNSVEELVPDRLLRDYYQHQGYLSSVRGAIDPLLTSQKFITGQLEVFCRFEEFEIDIPANRIIREALRRISQLSYLPKEIRSSARAKFLSIDPISEYSTSDLKVVADRRMLMEGYEPALTLAKDLLSNQGRSIEDGKKHSNIFLQYTPLIVEEGLRSILKYDLRGRVNIKKEGINVDPLKPAQPDLIFELDGCRDVGDIKYKNVSGWEEIRGDLYQSVFFAAAAKTFRSVVTAFDNTGEGSLPDVSVGNHTVSGVLWNSQVGSDPDQSRKEFVNQIADWVSTHNLSLQTA